MGFLFRIGIGILFLLSIPVVQASPTLGIIEAGYNFAVSATGERLNWLYKEPGCASYYPITVSDYEVGGSIWVEDLQEWFILGETGPETIPVLDFLCSLLFTKYDLPSNYAYSTNYGYVINDGNGNLSGIVSHPDYGDTDFSGIWIDEAGYFRGTLNLFGTTSYRLNCEDDQSCHLHNFKIKTDWVPLNLRSSFTGEVELSTTEVDYPTTRYTLRFTPLAPIPNNGTILLTFPPQYADSFEDLLSADVALSAINVLDYEVTLDTASRIIRINVETLNEITDQITIVIGDGVAGGFNDLANPSIAGQYGIGISLFNTFEEEFSSGIAYANIANSSIEITASIIETLTIQLSNTALSFALNPSLGLDRDRSQYTEFTIAMNAPIGYVIYAQLRNSLDANALRDDTLGESIPSGTGVNTFGYEATNAAWDAEKIVEASEGFAATSTILQAGMGTVGRDGATNEQQHTIYYDLFVDYLTAPGFYTGTLTYTITPTF